MLADMCLEHQIGIERQFPQIPIADIMIWDANSHGYNVSTIATLSSVIP